MMRTLTYQLLLHFNRAVLEAAGVDKIASPFLGCGRWDGFESTEKFETASNPFWEIEANEPNRSNMQKKWFAWWSW